MDLQLEKKEREKGKRKGKRREKRRRKKKEKRKEKEKDSRSSTDALMRRDKHFETMLYDATITRAQRAQLKF